MALLHRRCPSNEIGRRKNRGTLTSERPASNFGGIDFNGLCDIDVNTKQHAEAMTIPIERPLELQAVLTPPMKVPFTSSDSNPLFCEQGALRTAATFFSLQPAGGC